MLQSLLQISLKSRYDQVNESTLSFSKCLISLEAGVGIEPASTALQAAAFVPKPAPVLTLLRSCSKLLHLGGKSRYEEVTMASVQKRGRKYQAKVRIEGHKLFATFDTEREAIEWGKREEAKILLSLSSAPALQADTFGSWVEKYIDEVADRFVTAKDKKSRLGRILGMPVARQRVEKLTPGHFETLKGKLYQAGLAPQTVRHYLQDCSAVWERARKEWKVTKLTNPLHEVDMPPVAAGRKRRVPEDLWGKILPELKKHVNPFYAPFAEFLLETAMRVHEPLKVRVGDIDTRNNVLTVVGKNGVQRTVPLSPRALELTGEARELRKRLPVSFSAPNGGYYDLSGYDADVVWPLSYRGFARAWADARHVAGDDKVWIHDIRRERATRLIEDGWDLSSVAVVTGHKSLRTLNEHYAVVEAQQVASRLAQTQEREGRPRRRGSGRNGVMKDSK